LGNHDIFDIFFDEYKMLQKHLFETELFLELYQDLILSFLINIMHPCWKKSFWLQTFKE